MTDSKKPAMIIVFDEVESMTPAATEAFLKALEAGTVSEASGVKVSVPTGAIKIGKGKGIRSPK